MRVLIRLGIVVLAVGWSGSAFAQESPLSRLLRSLLVDRPARSTDSRVPIDSPAPRDQDLEALWRESRGAAEAGDWSSSLELLQRILDTPGDAWIPSDDGRWHSLQDVVRQHLTTVPESVRKQYLAKYSGLAEKLLDNALSSSNSRAMADVARRFGHTPAGQSAAEWLARRHVDRGEFALAVRWIRDLTTVNDARTRDVNWRVWAAFVAHQSGDLAFRDELLAGLNAAEIAGAKIDDPAAWIARLPLVAPRSGIPLSNWPQPLGTSSRDGYADQAEVPLMAARWSTPLIGSVLLNDRLSQWLRDILESGTRPSPAGDLLAVNNLLIVRDLRGARALSVETGETLWHTAPGESAERILSGQLPEGSDPQEAWRFRVNRDISLGHEGVAPQDQPLVNLLARDAAWGGLTSDGERLFLLEDQAILTRSPFNGGYDDDDEEPRDAYHQDWRVNRLTAYSLETGRPLWTVGGPASASTDARPGLAGAYFHGPPTVDGRQLLVLASVGQEYRLCTLDTATGEVVSNQLISYPDSRIDKDLPRRWIWAAPSVSQGVVICPTTVGWVVAIDRERRSILWAREVEADQNSEDWQESRRTELRPLGQTWEFTPPLIVGSTVILAMAETNRLTALDLVTGETRWSLPRGEQRWLIGLKGDTILVAGSRFVLAHDARTGEPRWRYDLRQDRQISGRPALAESLLAVPVQGENLVLLNPDTGEAVETFEADPAILRAANLQWVDGSLVIHSFAKVTRLHRLSETSPDGSEQAREPWRQHLWRGRVAMASRDFAAVWKELAELSQPEIPPDAWRERQELLFAAVQELARDPQGEPSSAWIDRLRTLADSPERRAIALQWTLSHGEGDQLAQVLDAFQTNSLPAEFARIDAPRVITSRDAWFAGAIGDELRRHPDRPELRPLIEHLAQLDIDTSSLAAVDDSSQQAGWRRFVPGWTTWATRQLTERDWRQSPAAFDFLALQTRAELPPDERPRFDRQLVDLLRRQQRDVDAAALVNRLLRDFSNAPANSPDEAPRTIAESLANLPIAVPPDRRAANVPRTFPDSPLTARQTSVNYAPPREALRLSGAPPVLAGMRFEIDPQERRLMMFDMASGRLPWNPPLRGPREQQSVGGTVGRWLGPVLFLAHQGVLHAVSPLEKTIRWSHDLGRLPMETMMTADSEPDFQTSHPAISRRFSSLRQQALRDWPIVAVTPTAIVLHSDRRLTVLDPWTGTERWRFEPLPSDVLPLHLGGTVFFVSEFGLGDVTAAHRLDDGRPLSLDTPSVKRQLEIARETLALLDDRAISWKGGTGLNLFGVRIGRATLSAADARTGRDIWAHEFPAESRVAILDSERVLVVEPSGKTVQVNLASGSIAPRAPYPVRLTRGATVHALCDAEFDYLIVDRDDLARSNHYAESLASIPANGLVAAWNRSTGELAWSRVIGGQYLLVSGFESSPVLVFLSRGWQQRQKLNFSTLKVDVWRKADGKPLYSKNMPSMYSGFHTCDVHAASGTIDLIAYNLRLRLSPDLSADPAPVSALAPANSSTP